MANGYRLITLTGQTVTVRDAARRDALLARGYTLVETKKAKPAPKAKGK